MSFVFICTITCIISCILRWIIYWIKIRLINGITFMLPNWKFSWNVDGSTCWVSAQSFNHLYGRTCWISAKSFRNVSGRTFLISTWRFNLNVSFLVTCILLCHMVSICGQSFTWRNLFMNRHWDFHLYTHLVFILEIHLGPYFNLQILNLLLVHSLDLCLELSL